MINQFAANNDGNCGFVVARGNSLGRVVLINEGLEFEDVDFDELDFVELGIQNI